MEGATATAGSTAGSGFRALTPIVENQIQNE